MIGSAAKIYSTSQLEDLTDKARHRAYLVTNEEHLAVSIADAPEVISVDQITVSAIGDATNC